MNYNFQCWAKFKKKKKKNYKRKHSKLGQIKLSMKLKVKCKIEVRLKIKAQQPSYVELGLHIILSLLHLQSVTGSNLTHFMHIV